ncbi:hypothetical protein Poly30_08030 [Planctomycetes bacterium Poly30]|uniref:Flavohemoglobin expression-modulating QEGLA motif protein n=1 Tax=Saltatorellus ferox TaxID=2528018 RepID=A0A518EMJ0_9BACT|nr:hypothetical protein Poly30_08030 [Planctomycetes bacterium Poly30]
MSHKAEVGATIRELSDQLIEAQRPIRILEAVKWDEGVKDAFFRGGCKSLPKVDSATYSARALGFDPEAKIAQLFDLELQTRKRLGEFNPVGKILRRMALEYSDSVRMIAARGTENFSRWSQELYGSAHDVFYQGEPTMAEFGEIIAGDLAEVEASKHLSPNRKTIPASEAVGILSDWFAKSFATGDMKIDVRLSDGIIADAAAGADYIKLRANAHYSERDLRLLEAHEGWVHVGTTLNGLAQPYCTFLSKGPPSSTITQEGIAIFIENVSFRSYPERVLRVANRVRAVAMAEDGADFLDVFRFYREQGLGDGEAYNGASRVFRGSLPDGKPFTKDISYVKGFVQVFCFVQLAIKRGLLNRIPMLFCGKATLEDIKVLSELVEEGLVVAPKLLPPQMADMHGLVAWMSYSNFLRQLSLTSIERDYATIL